MKFFHISVDITGFNPDKIIKVTAAADSVFNFGGSWFVPQSKPDGITIQASNLGVINIEKESEEAARQVATDIANKIWDANGAYCKVHVAATCLSDKPDFEFDITAAKEIFSDE